MSGKRLGIFLFYDKHGIAGEYIEYMLKDIRPCLDKLIAIVNGKICGDSLKMIESIADETVIRDNIGFDIGAWQYGIVNLCGKDGLAEYDSLVLFNDSFFGPFYPFAEIFEKMDKERCDFWGLSIHGEVNGNGTCPYGYRPRYIQTYFMVFEKRLLHSLDFFSFWEKQPLYSSYSELAEKFVAVMTKQFSDMGYKYGAYCDTADLEGERSKNFDQHTYNIYELIANRRFPVIKRRSFYTDKASYMQFGSGNELMRAVEFIEKNYDYDIMLIFKELLRLYEPEDIKESLCLDYALPDCCENPSAQSSVLVIAHLVYEDMFKKYMPYIKNIPREAAVVITTNSQEKASALETLYRPVLGKRLEIRLVENRGRDMSALLVGCRDLLLKYKYLCFVHDKKSSQKEYSTVGAEFDRLNWENMLGSEGYIRNIIKLLEEHKYIGLLSPCGVNHGSYFYSSVDYWTVCYDICAKTAEKLGIKKPDPKKQPLAIGTCFWCRTQAMQALFENDFTYEDFPSEPAEGDGTFSHAIERLLPYAAAQKGFCTGWVYTLEYARTYLSSLRYMTDSTARALSAYSSVSFASFKSFLASISSLGSSSSKTELSMGERTLKAKRKNNLKLKIKSVTPEFALKIYRRIKYK